MVSFNQLNIVIGISVAFFTNYLILTLGQSDTSWVQSLGIGVHQWRWMLGLETLPAVLYFFALFSVPESPRWLVMHGNDGDALAIMTRASGEEEARRQIDDVKRSIASDSTKDRVAISELFAPAMRLVLTIGVVVAVIQQITGINSVFFYAPMIFEQSGIGTDASFSQAILVGIINLVFTVLAIALIDRLGRKPLLAFGLTGIAVSMFVLAFGFYSATYTLTPESIAELPEEVGVEQLSGLQGQTFAGDVAFKTALRETLGRSVAKQYEGELITAAIKMNPLLVLFGILGFVASFAFSIGPVMWVLFSELFPNRVRGLAISFVGLINSAVSFTVQLVFPWELANFGSALTFLIYGLFGAAGLIFILILLPETKGKSLEELEAVLVRDPD
jgi:MFS family permease